MKGRNRVVVILMSDDVSHFKRKCMAFKKQNCDAGFKRKVEQILFCPYCRMNKYTFFGKKYKISKPNSVSEKYLKKRVCGKLILNTKKCFRKV